jgi:Fe-S oxidoreductase
MPNEPPEIYSLKHDYFDLFPNQTGEISRRVKNVWLLDEYLVRCAEFNDLRVAIELSKNIDRNTQVIKFHPHCHQHSEGPALDGLPYGSDATITTLRTYGYEVELFEAGCCGMAGTFGYETEHYQLSIKVGELRLLPSIRQLQSEIINRKIIIASTGAACRLQIQHGTGISAVHPVELIRDRLMSLSDIAFRGGPKPAAVVS